MIKYLLKNEIDLDSFDVGYDYLVSQGVADCTPFLGSPRKEDELSPFLLENMERGLNLLKDIIAKNKSITIVVDSDNDGVCSAAIIHKFINKIAPHIRVDFYMHEGKEHGIDLPKLGYDFDLLILPDSASNQYEELEILSKRGHKVLVLDHHEVDGPLYDDENVVIINNQTSPSFSNKSSSGAGVTYKFVQAYDTTFGLGRIYEEYNDLAAIGIIGDIMDCRTLDNNYIIKTGLKEVKNKFFKALCYANEYTIGDVDNMNQTKVAWNLVPVINGVIRLGSIEDKSLMYEAIVEENETHQYYMDAAKSAMSIRNKQNRIITKVFENIVEEVTDLSDAILIYDTTNRDIPKTLTGLVANKMTSYFKKPVIVAREKITNGEKCLSGSLRSFPVPGFEGLKPYLETTELCNYVAGHANAAGVEFKMSLLEELVKKSNEELAPIEFGEMVTDVNYVFNNANFNFKSHMALTQFAKMENIYGTGIKKPVFAFEFTLGESNFKFKGKTGGTLGIQMGTVEFIQFKTKVKPEDIPELCRVKIIGYADLNVWRGRESLQIKIDQIEIEGISPIDLI